MADAAYLAGEAKKLDVGRSVAGDPDVVEGFISLSGRREEQSRSSTSRDNQHVGLSAILVTRFAALLPPKGHESELRL